MESSSRHFIGEIAQKAVIALNDAVLLQRDAGNTDVWDLPGGRLHNDEAPREGIRREILEELGGVEIGEMFYSEQFVHTRSQRHHLLLAYRVVLKNPDKKFILDPQEAAEIKWITKCATIRAEDF